MEKIWLKSYPVGITETIVPIHYSSISALLHESFYRYSSRPAFEHLGTRITYAALHRKSTDLAAYFQKHLRLVKGDRLAIMLPNILQYPITLLAALRLGLIIVNINPFYTKKELVFPLQDSGAVAIVAIKQVCPGLLEVMAETSIKHIILTELGDEFPLFKRVVVNRTIPSFVRSKQWIRYRHAMGKGHKDVVSPTRIKPDDPAFLQYTGGTTGKPKAAILTHGNLMANILQCSAWGTHFLEEGKEVAITPLPFYHIFSLTICCFTFLRLGGLSVLIADPRNIRSLVKRLRKTPFTVLVGVHTLYSKLVTEPSFKTLNFLNLKLALAGGMPVTKELADAWKEVTNKPIIMGYGLTEASPVVAINPLNSAHFNGSIGLPLPSTNVLLLDDEGNSVSMGSAGELCVAGPQVMKGYWHQPEETDTILDRKGWLHTGDIAVMNEQGYIYIIGRKKDMILVSGFNVYPFEVEEVIGSHPGVAEVAVIGVPNSKSGESIKAFIVKKDIHLTQEDIRKLCQQKLTGYKQPKYIIFCDKLPKNTMGKVLKEKLRKMAI
jgi:long-chain acyl-CoA synthetase